MRRLLVMFVALTGCAQPEPITEVTPDAGSMPLPPTGPTGNGRPPIIEDTPARYFLATASMPYLQRIVAVEGVAPRRVTPYRGAGYGRGDGNVHLVAVTPSERLGLIQFSPLSSSGTGALYVAALDGFAADTPVLVADDVERVRSFAIDETRVAFVDEASIRVVRLDGSDATNREAFASIPEGEHVAKLKLGPTHLGMWTRTADGTRDRVRAYPLDDPSASPVSILPDPGSFDGTLLQAILPDGRFLVRASDRSYLVDPDGQELTEQLPQLAGFPTFHSANDAGTLLLFTYQGSTVSLGVVRLDESPPTVESRFRTSEILAMDVSADRRSIFVMSYSPNLGDYVMTHVAMAGGEPTELGALPVTAQRALFASSDGRRVVLCAGTNLHVYGVNEAATVFVEGCRRRTLVGLDASARHALFVGSLGVSRVSLVDATEVTVANETVNYTILSDGILGIAARDGESTIYRMDQFRRIEAVLPWTSPPITDVRIVDDVVAYRRQDRWYAFNEKSGVERLVARREEPRFVGVTRGHLVLADDQSVTSHPLDGTIPDGVSLPVDDSRVARAFVAAGRYVWSDSQTILSVAVEHDARRRDAIPLYTAPVDDAIVSLTWNEELGRVLFTARSETRMSISSASLDGGPILQHDPQLPVPWSAQLESIVFTENDRRALVTFRNVINGIPASPGVWSVGLEPGAVTKRVGRELQEMWGTPPPIVGPRNVVMLDQMGLHVANWETGAVELLVQHRLFRLPRAFVSPARDWIIGRDARGLHAISPTGRRPSVVVTERLADAVFAPDNTLYYTADLPESSGVGVFSVEKIGDGVPVPITPPGFRVSNLLGAEEDGLLLNSLEGGDRSVYLFEYGETFPRPLTPIDDANEIEIIRPSAL